MCGFTLNRAFLVRFLTGLCFLLSLAVPSIVTARDDSKPPAKGKWLLPKSYMELDLSNDQKDRVTRILETYNPEINQTRQLLESLRRQPLRSTEILATTLRLKKLVNDREKLLNQALTEKQREKLSELNAAK